MNSNVFVGCWFHTWVPREIRWRGGQGWLQGTSLEDSLREFPGDARVEPSRPSNELGRVTSSTAPKNIKPIFPELIVNSDVSVGCWFHKWAPREIPGGVTPGGSGQGYELDGSPKKRKTNIPRTNRESKCVCMVLVPHVGPQENPGRGHHRGSQAGLRARQLPKQTENQYSQN